jgi:hypothetical protein
MAEHDDCHCGHDEASHRPYGLCFGQAGLGGDPDERCTCCAFSPYAAGPDEPLSVWVSPLAYELLEAAS